MRYGLHKILQVKVTTARSNQGHTITLHTYTPNQCPYHISTSYTLQFLRYSPDKNLKVKVNIARSKFNPRSHHDVAHVHPLTNVHMKCQLPTLLVVRYNSDKVLKFKLTTARSNVKSRSHRDDAHLHPRSNVHTKEQLATPYRCQDIAGQIRF